MGTTSKLGLRYPEGTVQANTLHTHIKNLADDVDAKLPTLKKLGEAWWQSIGPQTSPFGNNGTDVYAYVPGSRQGIPAGSKMMQIHFDTRCRAQANAACYWGLCGQWETGAQFGIITGVRRHNGGDQYADTGCTITGWVDVAGHTEFKPYAVINVDSGGVGMWPGIANFHAFYFA